MEGKQFMLAEGQWLEGQNARLTLSGDLIVEVTPNDAVRFFEQILCVLPDIRAAE